MTSIDLLTELREDRPRAGSSCAVCTWLESRPKDEDWAAAFADPSIRTMAIFRAMKKRDFAFGDTPVRNHRQAGH